MYTVIFNYRLFGYHILFYTECVNWFSKTDTCTVRLNYLDNTCDLSRKLKHMPNSLHILLSCCILGWQIGRWFKLLNSHVHMYVYIYLLNLKNFSGSCGKLEYIDGEKNLWTQLQVALQRVCTIFPPTTSVLEHVSLTLFTSSILICPRIIYIKF